MNQACLEALTSANPTQKESVGRSERRERALFCPYRDEEKASICSHLMTTEVRSVYFFKVNHHDHNALTPEIRHLRCLDLDRHQHQQQKKESVHPFARCFRPPYLD